MTLTAILPTQKARLATLLQVASRTPGYHPRLQQAGLLSNTTGTWALASEWETRFGALPILDKDTVRQYPGAFLARPDDIVYRGSTSGSRSRSYVFFAGTAWNQQRIEARRQFLEWWGIDDTVPIIHLASRLMPGRPGDVALVGAIDEALLTLLLQVLRDRPAAIRGYPSRLCEVANYLRPPLPTVHAVICTGEVLFAHQRSLLEQVFQAPVVNEYGCHEAAACGLTCPERGRLHLDETRCLYEVVEGDLITTDLWNETMPLLRYRCGDRVAWHPDPCPCGRPGQTVTILGRVEDRILTRAGYQDTATVDLPPLPGIAHYRVSRPKPDQVMVCVQSHNPDLSSAVQAIEQWAKQIFGPVAVQVKATPPAPPPSAPEEPWDDAAWLATVTQGSLGTWLSTPRMPTGATREIAQVLRMVLSPRAIASGLPRPIQTQIEALADSPTSPQPQVEEIKIRVLLLACSSLAPVPAAHTLYLKVIKRLQALPAVTSAHTNLDRLIPSLYLPTVLPPEPSAVTTPLPARLDTLNIHHFLCAFEAVIQRQLPGQRPLAARQLNPLLAVLIGDLSCWAPRFHVGYLAHWFELVQGLPAPASWWSGHLPETPFLAQWLLWRQGCLQNPQACWDRWPTFQAAATTPAERMRLQVEKGYAHLWHNEPLDPATWLPLIEAHAAGLSGGTGQIADLTPWMPLVRALVDPLQAAGQGDLAYRCLVAASLSSRQQSAFERFTLRHNGKQFLLTDSTG